MTIECWPAVSEAFYSQITWQGYHRLSLGMGYEWLFLSSLREKGGLTWQECRPTEIAPNLYHVIEAWSRFRITPNQKLENKKQEKENKWSLDFISKFSANGWILLITWFSTVCQTGNIFVVGFLSFVLFIDMLWTTDTGIDWQAGVISTIFISWYQSSQGISVSVLVVHYRIFFYK